MRRAALLTLGLGEFLVAGVLIYLGYGLPSASEVRTGFAQAGRVTTQASDQVRLLRRQVHALRALELRDLAERLKAQTHSLAQLLRGQPLDFALVGTVRDAVGELAKGLGGLAEGLDPAAAGRLGAGLGETATFLEDVVIPTAAQAAPRVERDHEPEALVKDLAAALRQAAKGIDTTVARWPELQTTLARLAGLLGVARGELDVALWNRKNYEDALEQTLRLAEGLATLLPVVTDQIAGQLDHQDQALDELGQSIDDFGTLLPVYERSATHLIQTGRLLAWLVAVFVLVHVIYLLSQQVGVLGCSRSPGRP